MHSDSVLSLQAIADPTSVSLRMTTFIPNRNVSQSDSDYKSDLRLESADCQVVAEGRGDMQYDSDMEGISQPPARGHLSSQDTIPGAERPGGNVDNYRELNHTKADEPQDPFSSEADFNLTSWFIGNKVGKSQIDVYFAEGLSSTNSRSLSTNLFRNTIQVGSD